MTVAAPEIVEENERLKTEVKILSLRVKALENELWGRVPISVPPKIPGREAGRY
jgi:hypothetical protein